jgi:hypothetical protein
VTRAVSFECKDLALATEIAEQKAVGGRFELWTHQQLVTRRWGADAA